MLTVKVVFEMLGGVSSILCTAYAPPSSLRSKDWPSTKTCLQSKLTAVVSAEKAKSAVVVEIMAHLRKMCEGRIAGAGPEGIGGWLKLNGG